MDETFSIKRRIEIDMAHRVPDHGSKCFNIHGHRYVIEVTLTNPLVTHGQEQGMVMDFGFLKDLMMSVIHDPCDHGCMFRKDDPVLQALLGYRGDRHQEYTTLDAVQGWKIIVIDDSPTAENLAAVWHSQLSRAITSYWINAYGDSLHAPTLSRVTVHETPNCEAWYPA